MSPVFAVALLVCVYFCGLTVDTGRMELLKQQMQVASDAAAIGAELEEERGTGTMVSMGKLEAANNGFTDGQNNTTVTIIQNPTSGPYVGRYDAIQVTITQQFKTYFMGALNGGTYTLNTQSISLVPPCSYFTGTQAQGIASGFAYTFWNASARHKSNCPVYIGYNYLTDGFSELWGFGLDVVGPAGVSQPTGWTSQVQQDNGGNPAPTVPTYGLPVLADPLAYLTQPTFSATCPAAATTITSGTLAAGVHTSTTVSTGTVTINPGTYCGTSTTKGLTITHATVTLNPGLYIITGGSQIDFSTIYGNGVTIFFTKGNGAQYGQFNVGNIAGGQSSLQLSAPTTTANGGTPAILFWADRNWVQTASMDFTFGTYGSFSGNGIWYLPNAGIYIWLNSGGFTMPQYGSFVARNIYCFGTQVPQQQDYSWLSGGSPFRTKGVLVQ